MVYNNNNNINNNCIIIAYVGVSVEQSPSRVFKYDFITLCSGKSTIKNNHYHRDIFKEHIN